MSTTPSPPVDDALAALDSLVRQAVNFDVSTATDADLETHSHLLADVERALDGYLTQTRTVHTAALHERARRGTPVSRIADELGVSAQRVRARLSGNPAYESRERRAARAALAARNAADRAARAAAREAERYAAAAARVAEGRALAERLAAGETRDAVIADTGYSRQRLASLLTAARKAGAADAWPTSHAPASGAR